MLCLKQIYGMLVIETLKCKISDFLNCNTCSCLRLLYWTLVYKSMLVQKKRSSQLNDLNLLKSCLMVGFHYRFKPVDFSLKPSENSHVQIKSKTIYISPTTKPSDAISVETNMFQVNFRANPKPSGTCAQSYFSASS
jgi:hypothetical protein